MHTPQLLLMNGRPDKKLNSKGVAIETFDLEEASHIWELRKSGKSPYAIGMKLGISVTRVRKIINYYMEQCTITCEEGAREEKLLDLDRANELLETFMPIAKMQTVQVERTNARGETYTDEEWKYCIRAAEIVLKAMDSRARLLNYGKENGHSKGPGPEVTIWLKETLPSITKMIAEQPEESHPDIIDVEFDDIRR